MQFTCLSTSWGIWEWNCQIWQKTCWKSVTFAAWSELTAWSSYAACTHMWFRCLGLLNFWGITRWADRLPAAWDISTDPVHPDMANWIVTYMSLKAPKLNVWVHWFLGQNLVVQGHRRMKITIKTGSNKTTFPCHFPYKYI